MNLHLFWVKLLAMIVTTLWLVVRVTPAYAQTQPLYETNFTSIQDLTNWTQIRNFQFTNPAQPCWFQTQPAFWQPSSIGLHLLIDGPACLMEHQLNQLILSDFPEFKLQFDLTMLESTLMDRILMLGYHDANNWHGLKLFFDGIEYEKVVGGQVVPPHGTRTTYPFTANQTYHFSIKSQSDKITVLINDQQVLEIPKISPHLPNPNFLTIRSAVGAKPRSTSILSNFSLSQLSDTVWQRIPHFKQTDPLWADNEYDTATKWSDNPTIARWGCATSSMAMILHAHGITHLPDQTPINPDTLNTWLNTQPDGYIGDGLINWWAVTRLTQHMSEANGTPKLEYRRYHGDTPQPAQEHLAQHQPVIFEIPGHFLVGAETTSNNDFIILDPSYPYTHLSQHQTQLNSTRTFTPSQTDLSFVVIPHSQPVVFSTTDSEIELQTYQEVIQDQESGEFTSTWLTTIRQPNSDTLQLSATSQESVLLDTDIYIYNSRGEVTILPWLQPVGPDQVTLEITIDKDGNDSSVTTQPLSWGQLRSELAFLYNSGQISSHLTWSRLDRYLSLAGKSENRGYHQRVIGVIMPYIANNKGFSAPAAKYVQKYLDQLLSQAES